MIRAGLQGLVTVPAELRLADIFSLERVRRLLRARREERTSSS